MIRKIWLILLLAAGVLNGFGCGPNDANVDDYEDEVASATDAPTQAEKGVEIDYYFFDIWWAVLDGTARQFDPEDSGRYWPTSQMVYLCIPPDESNEFVLERGIPTDPPPACADTPCKQPLTTAKIDPHAYSCMEIEPE